MTDIKTLRKRLESLKNNDKKTSSIWKPKLGENHTIRIIPYKFRKDNPFLELYFHYNIGNRPILSPISFEKPDPIVEYANDLKRSGDRDKWLQARKLEPKLRTFAPILVRDEEHMGSRFWGFGKTVYTQLLGYITDEEYGDITDPETGCDIKLLQEKEDGKQFPITNIRMARASSKMVDNIELAEKIVAEQQKITDVFEVKEYDELLQLFENWLNSSSEDEDDETTGSSTSETSEANKDNNVVDDISSAFDSVYNSDNDTES